jgi:hypothetical protein
MNEKFTSFGDLQKIKDRFQSEGESKELPIETDTFDEEIETVSKAEVSENKIKEIPKLIVGEEVYGIDENQPISCWTNDSGGLYTKVSSDYYANRQDWKAITNKSYRGGGLIVFIDKVPKQGDRLKITQVFEKSAKGIII